MGAGWANELASFLASARWQSRAGYRRLWRNRRRRQPRVGRNGREIAVAGHDGEKAAAFATVLQELGADALGAAFDVLSVAGTERMVDQVANHFGRLDILVNCVGLNRARPAESIFRAVA